MQSPNSWLLVSTTCMHLLPTSVDKQLNGGHDAYVCDAMPLPLPHFLVIIVMLYRF